MPGEEVKANWGKLIEVLFFRPDVSLICNFSAAYALSVRLGCELSEKENGRG